MTYRVIVTPAAENDLRTAYRYIRSQAPRAARDWIRRARQSAKSLGRHPERCPLLPRASHSINLSANCCSDLATGELIGFCLLCSRKRNQFTYCMFGMGQCFRSDSRRLAL
jgi:hypothetical protein